MNLTKAFPNLRFPDEVIRKAMSVMELMSRNSEPCRYPELTVSFEDETWTYDNVEDFFANFRRSVGSRLRFAVPLSSENWTCHLAHIFSYDSTWVTVSSEHAHQVNAVMNVFKESIHLALPITTEAERLVEEPDAESEFNIFIGHGRSDAWEQLKNHLQDKHDYKVIAFESGARAGHQIRDILEDMLDRSSLAFLVLTGEDDTAQVQTRARQNVIHETGLFQGRLGFSRAIVLLEEGVEEFSNLHGVQHIPFVKGHINGTFGEVLAVIKRESRLPKR